MATAAAKSMGYDGYAPVGPGGSFVITKTPTSDFIIHQSSIIHQASSIKPRATVSQQQTPDPPASSQPWKRSQEPSKQYKADIHIYTGLYHIYSIQTV